ncbi:hypothetical protein P872_19740 [Rhodonellum psychrophilum GCM71 = DSM 17998]|uniref:Response regulatory domain-containing protein n=2 Tax=Rhodonellum TaxID=336827 RepID=U5BMC7_9BACT|nr:MULTISPECIES: response regulator [Rhodonellum]ERM81655.1 hypothetical protein P872_19740 [Rhodonellum psychrophilum GCM71 = DSM 17998]MDO9553410.1 response regulator [Rhodonellum sp.]SDZ39275.1 Response regulator receiver domain-containing protein [Rhodonellum ikkaensis]
MESGKTIKVFLVDDDTLFLKSLEIQFKKLGGFEVSTFESGSLCIANLNQNPDVIILDYHLDSIDKEAMNGIETLDKIKEIQPKLPVVMLSSQDKIEVAINCMHHHAHDYITKSETSFIRIQKNIDRIFSYQKIEKQLNWYMDRM